MQTFTDILYPPLTASFTPISSPIWDGPESRQGTSTLEDASIMLTHAVQYLVSEQFSGRKPSVQANQEAITILSRVRLELGLKSSVTPLGKEFTPDFRRLFR